MVLTDTMIRYILYTLLISHSLSVIKMLKFLKSCVNHMHSLSQSPQPMELRRTPTSTSSKTLLRSPSLLELLKSG